MRTAFHSRVRGWLGRDQRPSARFTTSFTMPTMCICMCAHVYVLLSLSFLRSVPVFHVSSPGVVHSVVVVRSPASVPSFASRSSSFPRPCLRRLSFDHVYAACRHTRGRQHRAGSDIPDSTHGCIRADVSMTSSRHGLTCRHACRVHASSRLLCICPLLLRRYLVS